MVRAVPQENAGVRMVGMGQHATKRNVQKTAHRRSMACVIARQGFVSVTNPGVVLRAMWVSAQEAALDMELAILNWRSVIVICHGKNTIAAGRIALA